MPLCLRLSPWCFLLLLCLFVVSGEIFIDPLWVFVSHTLFYWLHLSPPWFLQPWFSTIFLFLSFLIMKIHQSAPIFEKCSITFISLKSILKYQQILVTLNICRMNCSGWFSKLDPTLCFLSLACSSYHRADCIWSRARLCSCHPFFFSGSLPDRVLLMTAAGSVHNHPGWLGLWPLAEPDNSELSDFYPPLNSDSEREREREEGRLGLIIKREGADQRNKV